MTNNERLKGRCTVGQAQDTPHVWETKFFPQLVPPYGWRRICLQHKPSQTSPMTECFCTSSKTVTVYEVPPLIVDVLDCLMPTECATHCIIAKHWIVADSESRFVTAQPLCRVWYDFSLTPCSTKLLREQMLPGACSEGPSYILD